RLEAAEPDPADQEHAEHRRGVGGDLPPAVADARILGPPPDDAGDQRPRQDEQDEDQRGLEDPELELRSESGRCFDRGAQLVHRIDPNGVQRRAPTMVARRRQGEPAVTERIARTIRGPCSRPFSMKILFASYPAAITPAM